MIGQHNYISFFLYLFVYLCTFSDTHLAGFIAIWIDAEAESLILWLPHAKSWLIGKDPDAWRGCGQEEKAVTEDEMAG